LVRQVRRSHSADKWKQVAASDFLVVVTVSKLNLCSDFAKPMLLIPR
jgi:hypothetical protein